MDGYSAVLVVIRFLEDTIIDLTSAHATGNVDSFPVPYSLLPPGLA